MEGCDQAGDSEESLSVVTLGKRHWGRILARLERVVIARFTQPGSPCLALGDPIQLQIVLGGSIPYLDLKGTPTSCCEEGSARIFLFDLGQKDPGLPEAVSLQRSAIRVQPRVSSPIEVILSPDTGDRSVSGNLVDISESGMGLLLARPLEDHILTAETLLVSFVLPDSDFTFRFVSQVRNRRLMGDSIRYGLRFEPQSEGYNDQRNRLRDFVDKVSSSSPGHTKH